MAVRNLIGGSPSGAPAHSIGVISSTTDSTGCAPTSASNDTASVGSSSASGVTASVGSSSALPKPVLSADDLNAVEAELDQIEQSLRQLADDGGNSAEVLSWMPTESHKTQD